MSESLHSIKSWPRGERPREKLDEHGVGSLSDAELLAVLMPTRSRGVCGSSVDHGRMLLARFGGLRALVDAPSPKLTSILGIGPARAAMLAALGELARRYAAERLDRGRALRTSAEVFRHCGVRLSALRKEEFRVILLDGKNRPMREVRISEGSLTASLVHPREVFLPAIEAAAAAIILVHNHPSGDPTPSAEDLEITKRLRQAGELLGIHVLDHIVVGRQAYVSFADEQLA